LSICCEGNGSVRGLESAFSPFRRSRASAPQGRRSFLFASAKGNLSGSRACTDSAQLWQSSRGSRRPAQPRRQGNVRKTDADKRHRRDDGFHSGPPALVIARRPQRPARGKYADIAGRRRLIALKTHTDAGTLEEERLVVCTVVADGTDFAEIGIGRKSAGASTHPAGEFEVFKAPMYSGRPLADVATALPANVQESAFFG